MNKEQVDCVSKYIVTTLSRPKSKEEETINTNIVFPEKRRKNRPHTSYLFHGWLAMTPSP